MKKLSFLATRQFLAFVALIIVALLVWFVGPLISFGDFTPLSGVGMRVFIIVLLFIGVLLWLREGPVSIVFVVLLCLLIWAAAPSLAFGQSRPFESVNARLIAIAVVLLIALVYWGLKLVRKMREDSQFSKKVLSLGSRKERPIAAKRLERVEDITVVALSRLKAMRTEARGSAKLFQGSKHYLYELPWFITLGSNAAGKTSALLHGGLSFPFGEQVQRLSGKNDADRAPVDWLLTNDAVLIDTNGYYTRHGTSPNRPDMDDDALLPPASEEQPQQAAGFHKGESGAPAADVAAASPASARTAAPAATSDNRPARKDLDRAEWLGFLDVLRRNRPRMPVNGVLLMVDMDSLSSSNEQAQSAEAAALRLRLAELRETLGVRFPVYLMITKADQLTGFTEYFGSLTAEGRAQEWGFTLPFGKEVITREGLHAQCATEMALLTNRIRNGVNTRLQDEHDTARRRLLEALPEEFAALSPALLTLLERVFPDSRYDDTQRYATLRGVYFTSAEQTGKTAAVERTTALQRLVQVQRTSESFAPTLGGQGFFLHNLFTRIVFPAANLVSPNLRWEYRSRLIQLVGHALALILFLWLAVGLRVSFGNNSDYLDAVSQKAQKLMTRVTQFYSNPKPDALPSVLDDAWALPAYPNLNLDHPSSTFRYGLYTAPDIVKPSRHVYYTLEDNLLVPQIVHHMEDVISQGLADKNPKSTYDALRVYLMMYDKTRFNAADVKDWVLNDWSNNGGAAVFGGQANMTSHVAQLFSGSRVVQSPLIRNDALIQQARTFLDSSDATDRLYERAKAEMLKDAPDEFTLVRAVGPQAGTIFTRASGQPVSRGIPGIFTFDGYHNVFDKRLAEFVQIAHEDDDWVMGYQGGWQKKTADSAGDATGKDNALTAAIRRDYLTEYAQQWDAFLGDIRVVGGTSLAFNLQTLRALASPDSPLTRLARAAVHETTLSVPVATPDSSLLQRFAGRQAANVDKVISLRPSEQLERDLVDSHFAALREVVTGSTDGRAASSSGGSAPVVMAAGKTSLDGITSLLSDYYTALSIADNALSNNSMPPTSDAAAKLKMAATTMPAPFQAVLQQLASLGSIEVNQGIGQLLSRQMQAVVGETCRVTIEGNYPFAPDSTHDIGIDDFTRMFAEGGVIDDFFTKTLAPFVDTTANPWRYRTLPGATEPVQGPDLEPFQHARAIRDIFFTAAGQKQMSWKAALRVQALDPTISTLSMDIDGQLIQYQHGPVTPITVMWPGPRGGVHAEISASPGIRPETSTIATDGPWALMRLLQKGRISSTAEAGHTRVELDFDKGARKAVLDIASAGSLPNPLTSDLLKTFKCPSSMAMVSIPDTGPPPGLPPGAPPAKPAAH